MSTEDDVQHGGQRTAEDALSSQLTGLKRRRGGNIGYLRKVIAEIEQLTKDRGDKKVIEATLLANKDVLIEKEQELKDYHDRIMEHLDNEEDIVAEIEHHNNFLKDMRKSLHYLEKHLLPPKEDDGKIHFHPNAVQSARLPKLHLKAFDGNPLAFQSFWDTFDSTVHSNQSIDDISKFNYLKSLLEGKAKTCLMGLDTTSENYKHAIALIRERFGDPQCIINSHMDTLLSIRQVKTENVEELREIYDILEIHTRSLNAFEISAKNYGPVLNSIIMSKLPRNLKLDISRQMPAGKWDVVKLMDVFKRELVARERCETFENLSIGENVDMMYEKSSTLYTNSWKTPFCTYCSKDHTSNRCNTITDVAARKAFLKEKNRCYNCLRSGHTANTCFSRYVCFSCKEKHHISICDKKNPAGEEQRSQVTANLITTQNNTLLQTAIASVCNGNSFGNYEHVRILFDNGSQKSFIKSELRDRLKLKTIRTEVLTMKTFNNTEEKIQKLEVVNIKVTSLCGKHERLIEAYAVPIICSPVSNQTVKVALDKYPELRKFQLADNKVRSSDKEIDILIGANYYWGFTTGNTVSIDHNFVALDTILGWILSGSFQPIVTNVSSINFNSAHILKLLCEAEILEKSEEPTLERFWGIESTGVKEESLEFDCRQFLEKITWTGERYSVPLPWKSEHDILPDNFANSLNRLYSSMFRLKKNPGLLKEYDDIIKKQEEENIIEKIPENEGVATPGRVHYLPHHAVVRADRETTKLRVVYDASSNFPSLNQCLEKGPCFLPLIFDILVRFRAYKVALISDIKQAYLNVEVNREDRNFLRFFWFEDVNVETPKLAAYRFTRMIFGMNSSQFLLASVILKHLERYKDDPKFVKTFLRNLYVDDSVSGGENLHEALDLYVKSKYRLLEAGFTLRKWHSSDPTLDAKISSYENENIIEYASDPSMEGLKVLGVPWNNSADKFCLDLSTIQWGDEEVVNTKRTILKVIASIYDPLGLLAPATVLFKMFFQLLCISKLGWDRTLPDDLNVKWNKLICLSRNICVEVPRYYFGKNVVGDKEVILHGFCDASQRAYAAVIYLVADIGGKKIGHFVACKTKVAPIKSISIPQLELSSCVLLSNLFSSVVLALQGVIHISQSVCWSDSMDALFWIKEEHKRRTPFVENRIRKIREVIPSSCWRHCPGDLNPADFPSRGYEKYDNVINDKLISWVEGPDFIYKYQDQWPEDLSYKDNRVCSISKSYKKSEINDENGVNNVSLKLDIHGRPKNLICDVMSESIDQLINQKIEYEEAINKVKSSKINESISIMVSAGVNAAHHKLDEIINYNNYSNFNRLLRVTAHVMRFVHNVSCKDVQLQKSGPLKFEEVAEVEMAWIRVI